MNPQPLDIGPWQLTWGLIFIMLAQGTSLIYALGLFRDLLIGTVRTFGQLFIMGYVLTLVFHLEMATLTVALLLVMLVSGAQIIHGRVGEKNVPFIIPTFLSMLLSYSLVSILVTGVIIGAKPWWKPQYFIPIAGMVIGNSMNATAIALERLFSELRAKRDVVEMKLSLGADYKEASEDIVRRAVKAGMIPSINSLMGVGLVFIPGMMTGQILAGADPLIAIRYQIVVMLMLVGSTTLGAVLVVLLIRRRCFGSSHRLIIGGQYRAKE